VPAPVVPPAAPATVDAGGTTLPGIAVTGTGATPWYALDSRQRTAALPVVVTVTGALRPGDVLDADFARAGRREPTPSGSASARPPVGSLSHRCPAHPCSPR
jgi:hypothetical protein